MRMSLVIKERGHEQATIDKQFSEVWQGFFVGLLLDVLRMGRVPGNPLLPQPLHKYRLRKTCQQNSKTARQNSIHFVLLAMECRPWERLKVPLWCIKFMSPVTMRISLFSGLRLKGSKPTIGSSGTCRRSKA